MPLTRLSASQTYLEMKITNSFRRRLISHLNSSSLISSTWRRQWTTKLGEWKNNFYWEIRSLQIIEMNHLWPFSIGKVQKWVRARFYSSIETISVRHNIVRVHTHLHFHHRHRSLTCFFAPHSENLSSLEHINTACSVPIVILFSVDSDIPSLHRAHTMKLLSSRKKSFIRYDWSDMNKWRDYYDDFLMIEADVFNRFLCLFHLYVVTIDNHRL